MALEVSVWAAAWVVAILVEEEAASPVCPSEAAVSEEAWEAATLEVVALELPTWAVAA